MPRALRRSFPCVHSLYLSVEQDEELRDFADRAETTVSEVMREALAEFLARNAKRPSRSGHEPSEEARLAIAESARLRKQARGPARAPALPGMVLSGDLAIWQPPPGLQPSRKVRYAKREFPMANDCNGNPVEPPANAVAWRVLVRRHEGGSLSEYRRRGAPLVLDLRVKHHEFVYAVSNQAAAFYLEPIDEHGRVLRFTRVYVPLGDSTNWDDD
jgi:hypothetical protein